MKNLQMNEGVSDAAQRAAELQQRCEFLEKQNQALYALKIAFVFLISVVQQRTEGFVASCAENYV